MNEELERLRLEVDRLTGELAELRGMLMQWTEDPTLASMIGGTPRIAHGVVFVSPLNPRLRYALVREAGGGAKFVARDTLSPGDWSDA